MARKAADAAARWHVHQRRKGAAKEPYINHLLEVASRARMLSAGLSVLRHNGTRKGGRGR